MNAEEWRKQRAENKEQAKQAYEAGLKDQEEQKLAYQRNEVNEWLKLGENEFEPAYGKLVPSLLQELKERGFIIRRDEYFDEEWGTVKKYIFQ